MALNLPLPLSLLSHRAHVQPSLSVALVTLHALYPIILVAITFLSTPEQPSSFSFSRISCNLSPLYSLFSNHSPLHSLFLCIFFSHAHKHIHTPVHETLPRSSVLHLSLVFVTLLLPFGTIVLRVCPFRVYVPTLTLVTLFLYLILFFLQHGHVQTLFLLVRRISNPAHPWVSLFFFFSPASPGTSPFSLSVRRVFRTFSTLPDSLEHPSIQQASGARVALDFPCSGLFSTRHAPSSKVSVNFVDPAGRNKGTLVKTSRLPHRNSNRLSVVGFVYC